MSNDTSKDETYEPMTVWDVEDIAARLAESKKDFSGTAAIAETLAFAWEVIPQMLAEIRRLWAENAELMDRDYVNVPASNNEGRDNDTG